MPHHTTATQSPRHSTRTRLLLAVATLALTVFADTPGARAEPFGQCTRQRDVDAKIAACMEASRATSFPWILRWVYRELARAHRQRGDTANAIASYRRALAAGERACFRREMEELTAPPRSM
jgi:hypothetical protein